MAIDGETRLHGIENAPLFEPMNGPGILELCAYFLQL